MGRPLTYSHSHLCRRLFGACRVPIAAATFVVAALVASCGVAPRQATPEEVALLSSAGSDLYQPRSMRRCEGKGRRNCVVDGDTLWIGGEKMRLTGIDAPELKYRCIEEAALARKATWSLIEMVNNQPLAVRRQGTDRYGRTLARLANVNGDVGEQMIARGVAAPWRGRRYPASFWCS